MLDLFINFSVKANKLSSKIHSTTMIFSFFLSLLIHSLFFIDFDNLKQQQNANILLKQGSITINTIRDKSDAKNENSQKKTPTRLIKRIPKKGVISLEDGSSLMATYPYLSQIHREEGIVRVKLFVTSSGELEDYKFLLKSKHQRLNNEVVRIITKAKFKTTRLNGEQVSSVGIKEFIFKLK